MAQSGLSVPSAMAEQDAPRASAGEQKYCRRPAASRSETGTCALTADWQETLEEVWVGKAGTLNWVVAEKC